MIMINLLCYQLASQSSLAVDDNEKILATYPSTIGLRKVSSGDRMLVSILVNLVSR